jgi:hypothetical protein
MPTPEELQQDSGFMSATPADQAQYLHASDPDFHSASAEDQASYLAHVTKQPTEPAPAPKGLGGALDVANKQYEGPGVGNALGRLGTALPNMARQAYHAVTDPRTPEEEKLDKTPVLGRAALAGKRMLIDPSVEATEHVNEMAQSQEDRFKAAGKAVPLQGTIAKYAGRGAAAVPMVGPYALGLGERAGKGDVAGAVTEALGVSLAPEIMKEAMPGGALPGAAEAGARPFPTADAAVRTLGKATKAAGENAPAAGAVIGGVTGAAGGASGAAYGTYTGGRVGKIVGEPLKAVGEKLSKFGQTPEEKIISTHEDLARKADKDVAKAEEAHSIYAASEAKGPIDPEANPAYKKSMDALEKARTAQAEAHFHLQEAKESARVAAEEKSAEVPEHEPTAADVDAARPEAPEAPTPTKEENDAKLSGLMDQVAPEKPEAENVKGPGQVQPETFPQEPTEAPQVFTGMRKLGPEGQQGVMGRQLALPAPREAEGVPEQPKAAEPIPEAPKPATAAEMAGLKSVGGKVTEAPEKAVAPLVKQGLAEGSRDAKPIALKSLGEREKDALGRIKVAPEVPERTDTGKTLGVPTTPTEDIGAKVRAGEKSVPRTTERRAGTHTPEIDKLFKQARTELGEDATSDQVMARVDELKAEAPKTAPERSPEDMSKVEAVVKDHSDQELARLGKKYGVDESEYDFSKRDAKRHRIERDDFVNDLLSKMPEKDIDNIARLAGEFDNKDATTWTSAERNNQSRAQRARAIMQEHEGGPKTVAGGAPEEKVGTEEGAKQDTDHFAQAKKELPNGTLSEQAMRAQDLKHDAAIVEEHNAGTGSSILKDGKKVEDGYVVGINKELERAIDGEKITPEDVKAYRERPEVQKALKDNPKAFIGTWVDGGKTYFDTSIPEPDLETAKKLGKANEQKAIRDIKDNVDIPLEEARNLPAGYPKTEEEAEAKITKEGGVGGGAPGKATKAKPLPTGDDLIKKYGESDGDPAHTAFILPDGRGVAQTGTVHDEMLGGKMTDADPPRERFIEQGNIRVRAHGVYGNRETALSIPDRMTLDQLAYLKKMSPMLRSGAIMIEGARPGSEYRVIKYGEATNEKLESTIREISQIVPKNYPKGTPEVGGGAPSAAAAPAKESPALPELAEKHLTPEEKAGVLKSPAQTEKFVQRMSDLPEVHEYADIALAGEGARKWYQRSAKAFDAMTEEAPEYFKDGDKDKFLNLLAASSPRQSVAMNLRETLKTWKAYVDAGRPEGGDLEKLLGENLTPAVSKVPNALKALNGEEMWPDITKNKNFKVPSFAKNLRGWLGAVTSDGWMSLFAGLDPREISSAHSYHPLSVATRAAAEELGWEPAEAQAAIWSFTQALQERGEELPEEVRKHSEDFVDLMAHDPQVRDLLADLGVTHANLDAKLAAIGEKPEVSGRTTPTTSRSIERLKERIETARGKGAIPPPKSAQGELGFREAPAHESRVRDEDVEFNPEQFRTQTGEDTKLRPLAAKKKSPLGKAKR